MHEPQLGHVFEVCQAGVADVCAADVEFVKLRQAPQLGESRIGDRSVAEVEGVQPLEIQQMVHAGVADLRRAQIEDLQSGHAVQVRQLGIANAGIAQVQLAERGQLGQVGEQRRGELRAAEEVDRHEGAFRGRGAARYLAESRGSDTLNRVLAIAGNVRIPQPRREHAAHG